MTDLQPFDPAAWAEHCLWPDSRDAFTTWCTTRQAQGWEPEPTPMLTAGWVAYAAFNRERRETTRG